MASGVTSREYNPVRTVFTLQLLKLLISELEKLTFKGIHTLLSRSVYCLKPHTTLSLHTLSPLVILFTGY